jgi:CRP-like cAMP-binding protein
MTIGIGELKRLGDQALISGQYEAALKIFWRLVDVAAAEVEPRLKLADTLIRLNAPETAAPVFAATATHAMQAGHPLIALLIGKILETMNVDVVTLYDQLAALYSAESDRISRYGERFAPMDPETQVKPPDMEAEIALEALVAGASRAGADLSNVGEYPRMLHRLPLLSDLSGSTFRSVMDAVVAHRLPDGAMVIREGEIGASFFLVASGAVQVYRTDIQGREIQLATLHEGSLFGEMALIQSSPRTASVRVMGDADLLEVTREGLSSLASEMNAVAVALDRFTRERLLNNLLATAPLFRAFSRKQRLDLIRRFTGHEVALGTKVLREGDPGRGLYVVLSGEVDVTKAQEGDEDVLLANLKAGEVFGEIALIKGGPATATITAARQSTILFLDKVYFQRLINAIPEMKKYFDNLSEERLADTQLVMDDELLIEDAEEDERVLI